MYCFIDKVLLLCHDHYHRKFIMYKYKVVIDENHNDIRIGLVAQYILERVSASSVVPYNNLNLLIISKS